MHNNFCYIRYFGNMPSRFCFLVCIQVFVQLFTNFFLVINYMSRHFEVLVLIHSDICGYEFIVTFVAMKQNQFEEQSISAFAF